MAVLREVNCGMIVVNCGIAAALNSLEEPGFKVGSRSACDRYGLLVKKYETKWNKEEKSSGTNPDYTELDGDLMDLIQRFDNAQSGHTKGRLMRKN